MILSRRNLAFLLIFLGIVLRILYASMSVDVSDAYLNVVTAKSMRECACFPTMDLWGTSFIFRPPAGVFWMAIMMPYPIIAVVLAGIGLIWLTYLIARKIGKDKDDSLLAAAVVAITPAAISFSSTNSMDIFTGIYLASSLFFILSDSVFLSGVFSALGFLTKYDGLVFFPAPALYLAWKRRWKDLAVYMIIFGLIAAPWLIRMNNLFGNPLYPYFESFFGQSTTSAVGHSVPLYHYILGLPLTLFGVPEGSHWTALELAASREIPSLIVWAIYLIFILVTCSVLCGAWKSAKKMDSEKRIIIMLASAMYGFFFLARTIAPIGSDVLDLRYAIVLVPLIGIGTLELDKRWMTFVTMALLIGSLGLYARFALAEQAIQPLHEAVEHVKSLPSDAVILSDLDTTIYSYGISYETGRTGFPYMENTYNTAIHIPFLWNNYSSIKRRGPNFLWTTNTSRSCPDEPIFDNGAVKICTLEKIAAKPSNLMPSS